jgi:transporter family-2 protein
MIGILVGMLSGALMSIQGVFNTEATKQTSIWVTASFVQATALIVCFIAWWVTGKEGSFGGLENVQPRYLLLGGIIGAFITYTVVASMNSIGPARAVMFIVGSQLLVAYVIELFGIFGIEKQPFEMRKLIGLIIMIAGIVTFKWK